VCVCNDDSCRNLSAVGVWCAGCGFRLYPTPSSQMEKESAEKLAKAQKEAADKTEQLSNKLSENQAEITEKLSVAEKDLNDKISKKQNAA
jgi:outer membrane lipopolysaccharide assembly protein LptE/RlpB